MYIYNNWIQPLKNFHLGRGLGIGLTSKNFFTLAYARHDLPLN